MLLFLVFLASRPCLGYYDIIKSEVLTAHNEHRRTWTVPEFIESEELSQEAREYAIHLSTLNITDQILYEQARKQNIRVDHLAYPVSDSEFEMFSENICEFQKNVCVYYWATEGAVSYGIAKERRTEVEQSLADKFSAITWKTTTEIGVGWAPKYRSNKNGRKILVVRYSPAGNQPGEYENNIENPEFLEYFNMPAREEPDTAHSHNHSAKLSNGVVDVLVYIMFFVLAKLECDFKCTGNSFLISG
ncbi:uncharacterized protein LOC120448676 isoform X1 [Drosophila santomea]|uniref:uncharacterized protein LOC120448676 isoform X1 n=2 Tax=Drosophila santomea TaxID=129105 RepID=UPI0019533031|nr:uncharacterized protein LOC120448676 isoform X1 [Drosophila santomea]